MRKARRTARSWSARASGWRGTAHDGGARCHPVRRNARQAGPYELSVVDFAKNEHKAEPHLGRQPFGQLPAVDDDGFAFFESRAICRYVNEKVSGKLVPSDLKGRALMEEWISIETSNFTPHAMKFVYHYAFKRAQDDAVLAAAAKSLDTAFGVMEAQLTKYPHVSAWWNKISERPTWQKTAGRAS